jgi:ribosomal protein S8
MVVKSLFDSITRLRNASNLKMPSVRIRYSIYVLNILNILYELGFISGFKIENFKFALVFLRYFNNFCAFRSLSFLSRPTKFVFISKKQLLFNLSKKNFNSFFLISTNKGIFTDKQCISLGLGGLLVLEIF